MGKNTYTTSFYMKTLHVFRKDTPELVSIFKLMNNYNVKYISIKISSLSHDQISFYNITNSIKYFKPNS